MAIPQYAIPQVGSFWATAAKVSLAFSYQKEWSIATALPDWRRTHGPQETGKFAWPSLRGSPAGCSCWATAGGTNAAHTPTSSTMQMNVIRFMLVSLVVDRNFLFGLENDAIVRPSRLIATSRNDFSIGAPPEICHPHRHSQNRTILRPVFAILLLAQPSGKTDFRCRLDHPISLSRRYREQSDPAQHRPEPPPRQMSFRQQ